MSRRISHCTVRKCPKTIDQLVASRNHWYEFPGKRVAQQERWPSVLQGVNSEGTMAKAPPCPERRMRTPLPKQSSSSTREEECQWISQESAAIASHENAWKESRGTDVEDKRKRCVAFEDAATRMLKYPEDLKVGLSDLKEPLETLQVFLSCRLPNWQGLREAKSSLGCPGKKRLRCTSPAWRGG